MSSGRIAISNVTSHEKEEKGDEAEGGDGGEDGSGGDGLRARGDDHGRRMVRCTLDGGRTEGIPTHELQQLSAARTHQVGRVQPVSPSLLH
jgi:hypothetical protein